MSTLSLVNKFCDHNNFVPTELFTTNNNWVIAKYGEAERREYNRFMSFICNTKSFKRNKVKVILDPVNNRVCFSPKAYRG